MPVSLEQILASTRSRLPALRGRRVALERAAAKAPARPSLTQALRGNRVAVVAEVKRRSPSAGTIRADLDPIAHAGAYVTAGAAAISVLTDTPFFGGSLEDLVMVTARVSVPVLRKDFILDELQIVEARGAGAAAVLLIVRALGQARLRTLLAAAGDLGLDALVEVHTAAEAALALESGARLVGVNSRDLDTFTIDPPAAWTILQGLPPEIVAVAESGMATAEDVRAAAAAGADAVLIGAALSSAPDPAAVLATFTAVRRRDR